MRTPLYFKLAKKLIRCDIPYKYTFDITYRCNSRCKTCNIWKAKKTAKGEIKLWEFRRVLEKVKDHVIWLTLSGGEPTLRKDLGEFISEASKMCPNLRLINVSVNGLAPEVTEQRFSDALSKMKKRVNLFATVSIDGHRATHDKIRGRKGSWKKATSTLKKLKKLEEEHKNFSVGVQTTISKHNIKNVRKFIESMSDHKILLTFAHDVYLFRNRGNNLQNIDKNFKGLLDGIRKKHKESGMTGLASKIYMKLAHQHFTGEGEEMVLPCTATKATLTVDPYLNVQACVSMGFPIGNLRKNGYDIHKILKSQRCKDVRELIEKSQCCKCWMPCEAYPTIMHNLPGAIKRYIRGK